MALKLYLEKETYGMTQNRYYKATKTYELVWNQDGKDKTGFSLPSMNECKTETIVQEQRKYKQE